MTLGDGIRAILEDALPRVAEARDSYALATTGWTTMVLGVLNTARESLQSSSVTSGCRPKSDQNRSCALHVEIEPRKLSEQGDAEERERKYRLSFKLDSTNRVITVTAAGDGRELFAEAVDPRKLDESAVEAHVLRFVESMAEDLEHRYRPKV